MTNTSLTVQQKLDVIQYAEQHPDTKLKNILEWVKRKFGKHVDRSTISKILKSAGEIKQKSVGLPHNQKRRRQISYAEVDKKLIEWFLKNESHLIMTEAVLIEQATYLGQELNVLTQNEKITRGWINSFKSRHGIKLRTLHGEAGSLNEIEIQQMLLEICEKISEYDPNDVFNFDETALFYRLQPNKTLSSKPMPGKKKNLERITVCLCTNASGSKKLSPLIIGKHARPRCLKNIRNFNNLGISYKSNKTAWMTTTIFQEWLINFDKMTSSECDGRKVLLLLDNASAHNINGLNLSSVEVLKLPAKTTSKLQPLDAGIIASFKAKYKCKLIQHILEMHRKSIANNTKLTLLDAIRFTVSSWQEVSDITIQNCWKHTSLISRDLYMSENANHKPIDDTSSLQNLILQLPLENQVETNIYLHYEDISMQDDEQIVEHEKSISTSHSSTSENNDNDQDMLPEYPVITHQMAKNSSDVLIRYIEQSTENNYDDIKKLRKILINIENKIEKSKVQKSILDYFVM